MDENIKKIISKQRIEEIYNILHCGIKINYVMVKGEALSIAAYGATGKRKMGDIDILVKKEELPVLDKRLRENGFRQKKSDRMSYIFALTYSHQVSPYLKEMWWGNLSVDINFDVFWRGYVGNRVDIDYFLADMKEVEIHGYKINVLSPLKVLLQLILHNYKDMNSLYHLVYERPIASEKFKDIYYLVINNYYDISVDDFIKECDFLNISRYAYYIFYYTYLLYPEQRIKQYMDAVYCEEGEELLEAYGLAEGEKRKWSIDFYKRLNNNVSEIVKSELKIEEIQKLKREKMVF